MIRSIGALGIVASLSLALASCGDDGSSGSGGAGSTSSSTGGAGTTSASSGQGGGVDGGSPHTPETGCQTGFVECAGWCVDTTNDAAFCGDCNTACINQGNGLTCDAGACVPGACLGAQCGETCVTNRSSNADHCGSCFNQCASDALCFDGGCVDGNGDGTSCASPLFWNVDQQERVGFRFTPALTGDHVFPCGPLDALPTRWFRFTASKDQTVVEVRADGPDDFILEAFGAMACDAASSLGCNDDDSGTNPQLTLQTTPGATYYVAVGLKGTWSGMSASIRADH
jgi:hypothetical protein